MTREEAVRVLKEGGLTLKECEEAFDMAINALEREDEAKEKEQQDILEQIRAEIMQLYNEVEVVDYDHNDISRIKKAHWIIREEVLWILDKYNSRPKRGAEMKEGDS